MRKYQHNPRLIALLAMLALIAMVRIGFLAADVLHIIEEALRERVVRVDILEIIF